MPNVKGTLLKSLISKPVAEAKKRKKETKASLILKHYSPHPPLKAGYSL